MAHSGIRGAAARELAFLRRDRWEQALLIWFPLAVLALLLWLFSNSVPVGLAIAWVDEDHSADSRNLAMRIAAMRSVAVVASPASLEQSWSLVRRGEVYAVVHVPPGWRRERLRGTPLPVVVYENMQYNLGIGLVSKDVGAAVRSLGAERALGAETRFGGGGANAAEVRAGALKLDVRTLFNPALSYEAFLAGMMAGAMLHLFAVIGAVSALGREFRDRSVPNWLASGGGSLWRALLGKLLPLLVLYLGLGLLVVATLGGWRGWGVAGSLALWVVALWTLLVVALAIGLLFVGLTANLRVALSLTGLYVATALAFSGFSFPKASMSAAAQGWSALLPFTHYLPLQQGQWLANASAASWAQGMLPLLAFLAVFVAVGYPTLRRHSRLPAKWGQR
jgi:ABC-2 type transport system permease protein